MGLPQEGQGIKSMTRDMTVGNPVKLIVSFSIPLLIGNLFQQLYSMVDAVIVGQFLGVDALAAVGTTGPLSFLILGFVMGMTGGFSVLVAQRFGAGDYDGMRHTVAMSILLSVVLCIVMTALSVAVCRPLLVAMNTADNIIDMAYDYIIVIFAGTFANILYNLLSGILRALGDSRTPLYFLILSSLLNVVLDIFCVVNLQMGVAGAGYATVLSQFISGLLCLLYMIKKFPILHLQKKDWVFRRATCLHLLKVGAPMAFQFSITAIGVITLQGAVNSFGSSVTAGFTAASKVETLTQQLMSTLSTTTATFVGQNLGAGKMHRIREGVRRCRQITDISSLVLIVIVYLFWRAFVSLFISGDQPEVYEAARTYLYIIMAFYLPLGWVNIFRNALQGMGEAFVPLLGGVMELLMRVIVALFAVQFGFWAVCLASPMAWIGADIPLLITYRRHIRSLCAYEDAQEAKGESAVPTKSAAK